MAILIDENTEVVVQGATGKEGSRAVRLMKEYGTKVVAGVTPGKGGQEVEGIPVYNHVQDALKDFPNVQATLVVVPPKFAKFAIKEAIENNIRFINILTEGIPIKDSAELIGLAKSKDIILSGPSSVGIISPGKARVSVIGGENDQVNEIYTPGPIGIISKSGGMTNETAWVVKQAGLGQSTVIGMGGDQLVGMDFVDYLELFEKDPETKGVVIFGELGGTYEDKIAAAVSAGKLTKPIAAFIGGTFAEQFPKGIKFGHAGALIEGERGLPSKKKQLLREAGVLVAEQHHELGELIKNAINK